MRIAFSSKSSKCPSSAARCRAKIKSHASRLTFSSANEGPFYQAIRHPLGRSYANGRAHPQTICPRPTSTPQRGLGVVTIARVCRVESCAQSLREPPESKRRVPSDGGAVVDTRLCGGSSPKRSPSRNHCDISQTPTASRDPDGTLTSEGRFTQAVRPPDHFHWRSGRRAIRLTAITFGGRDERIRTASATTGHRACNACRKGVARHRRCRRPRQV